MKKILNWLFGPADSAPVADTDNLTPPAGVTIPTDPNTPSVPEEIRAVVVSDLGNVRQNNEDTGLFVRLADEGIRRLKGYLLLVADGMGGHLAGEVASQMAAEIVSREYFQDSEPIEKSLLRAFQMANRQIFEEARLHDSFRGMGTTCTAIVVHNESLYFAHVGDSRAYLVKAGQLIQLTEDQTYVQELLRTGEISAEAAATHPDRNVLTQAMGTKSEIRVDLGRCMLPFDQTDRLLLCSDGLYDYCSNDDLVLIMSRLSLPDSADELVRLAKSRGGHDNITVVLAERMPTAPEQPTAPETREIDLPLTRDLQLPQ